MRLIYDQGRFVCESTYQEREIPKAARFRWDPIAKRWWTDDPERAAALISYATPDAARAIEAHKAEAQRSIQASWASTSDFTVPVPDGLELYPFQRAGVEFASSRVATLIADEMGLGKTVQAIGLANAVGAESILVICPATLRLNWKHELERWMTRPRKVGIATSKGLPDTPVVIINYDIVGKCRGEIDLRHWDLLIVDECHYLKNPKAQRTTAVMGRKTRAGAVNQEPIRADRIVFMTGTPVLNRPVELWTLVHFLDPAAWPSFWRFAHRYCGAHYNGFGWDFNGASNLDELQAKLRSGVMLRRLKRDVLTELPPKVRQVVELSANGAAGVVAREAEAFGRLQDRLEELAAAAEVAKAADDEGTYRDAVERLREGTRAAFTEIAALRHATAVAKVPAVIEHLETALESCGKVIVFAHHHDVVDEIASAFQDRCVVLTGRESLEERQNAVDRFQSDPDVGLFIGSIQAAGVGLTLTAASHVVFAELDWVPANVTQAEDRCHRIGQRESVLIQHLVLEGSLDATMARTLVAKQTVIDQALDTGVDAGELMAEPVLPIAGSQRSVSARAQIAREAEAITAEQIEAAHAALRILAAYDPDGAQVINQMGFSKIDVRIGHDLASRDRLTPRQAALGRRIVLKYHRQLPDEIVRALRPEKGD